MLSLDVIAEVFAGEDAWVVGGAVRDDLLGRRPALDVDIACREPERAARALLARAGDAVYIPGNLVHRETVAPQGSAGFVVRTGGEDVDPFGGGADAARSVLRTVSADVFDHDPLRLLRGVRLEDELGFRLDPHAEELTRAKAGLITLAAGERILEELQRLSADGIERAAELGLIEPLGGRVDPRLRAFDSPWFRLAVTFGESLRRLPIPGDLRRFVGILARAQPPDDGSLRAIHRFRRATEPFALEALAYVGAGELAGAVEQARAAQPSAPLLRGDELGIPPGPEVGRLLELIAEERAAGTISTREEALQLVRRSLE